MAALIHKILYRTLPLEGYLRVVSRLFFVWQRLGIGRAAPETEYVYHLARLVRRGDVAIDIGANLGYYTRTIARLVGPAGKVYAVEPVPPILAVLRRNVRRCANVRVLPYALGMEERTITMANDSAIRTGYLGTGQNFVDEGGAVHGAGASRGGRDPKTDGARDPRTVAQSLSFPARMRRGSELFADLDRLDFVKCDIEGYEVVVLGEMEPLLARFRPTVLVETGGGNRALIVEQFTRLGYKGYTLDHGREVPLTEGSTKDIIFRHE